MINTFRKTPAIEMSILSTMKMKGTVGYAPNSNNRKRNQVISHNSFNIVDNKYYILIHFKLIIKNF